jgi:hypothetical protein
VGGVTETSGEGLRARRLDRLALLSPAALQLALNLAFLGGYGIFRDELYYLACAARLDWGYVDHPPLVAVVTALWTALAGDSLGAIRLLPAFAGAAAAVVVGSTARVMGGGRFAVSLAGGAAALAPVVLSLTSVLSMNAFDLLFQALLVRIVAGWLAGGGDRLWLAFGAVAGLGLQNKIGVLFLGFGVVVGLLLARRWEAFRSKWFWAGGAIAAALFAPHLVWQQLHGWPTLEFIERANAVKNIDYAWGDFLLEQVLQNGPLGAVVWIGGLAALVAGRRLRAFRPLGLAWLAVLALLLSAAAKPYYLAPVYAPLWAAGAVAIEGWARASRARRVAAGAFAALLVAAALAVAPLARPILPVDRYVAYAAALGEEAGTDERHEIGRLPQFFADMQEWRELAGAAAVAASRLTPEEERVACVFGQNYGEAGAVERFGRELGLPPAISAHNSWYLWGPGACTGEVLLVFGDHRERLEELFESVELGATFDCRDCMPYEDELPIWIARRPRVPLAGLWPEIKNFS